MVSCLRSAVSSGRVVCSLRSLQLWHCEGCRRRRPRALLCGLLSFGRWPSPALWLPVPAGLGRPCSWPALPRGLGLAVSLLGCVLVLVSGRSCCVSLVVVGLPSRNQNPLYHNTTTTSISPCGYESLGLPLASPPRAAATRHPSPDPHAQGQRTATGKHRTAGRRGAGGGGGQAARGTTQQRTERARAHTRNTAAAPCQVSEA